jgi:adenylosuccinate lyase
MQRPDLAGAAQVNPIDFENAEGNFGIASAVFDHLSQKLPISRLQRDLTDSTVTRNIGIPFGHCVVALDSLQKGLGKLLIDEAAIRADLNSHWEVTAEAIQTVLRREQVDGAYELLKEETRGAAVTEESVKKFVEKLRTHASIKLAPSVIEELGAITPENYVGTFNKAEQSLEEWAKAKLCKETSAVVAAALGKQRSVLNGA